MCVLLCSFDRNVPRRGGKAQQVLGKSVTLRFPSVLCEFAKIGNGHVFLLHVLDLCNSHVPQFPTLIKMLSNII